MAFCGLFIGTELNKQLGNWLNAADLTHGPARAIIAPLVELKLIYVDIEQKI